MEFGRHLTEIRRAKSLTQEELAEKIMVSRQAVSKWENDETLPDSENLVALADTLGVSIDYLCGRKTDFNSNVEKTKARWINSFKYFLMALAAIAVFISGFVIGADIKLKKENSRVYLPETVTISNVSFSKKNGELHYQFAPSVVGKGYKYKITFRDYADNEYSYEVPLSDSGCFGTAEKMESKFIDTVAVTVSSTDENRIIIVATNLQLDGDSVSWDSVK